VLIIYTAVKCVSPIVHRELMDMISAVKDMNVVSGLENVSKSKIRGIFGMLKTYQSLGFSNDDGDAVQLYMGEGVHSFEEFRNKTDSYFRRCLTHLKIFLPPSILSQLIWQLDSETMKRRMTEFKKLEETVESYFVFGKIPGSLESTHPVGNNLDRKESPLFHRKL
jgi:hypothetical protein